MVTKTEASAGLNGSSVVPSRPNWRAAAVANAPEAAAVAIAATAREADGPRAPFDSADWAKAAAMAKSGGGGRITLVTCHCVSRTSTAHPLPQPGFGASGKDGSLSYALTRRNDTSRSPRARVGNLIYGAGVCTNDNESPHEGVTEMILVIGGTGDLGGRVARILSEQGHAVRCLVRPASDDSVLRGLGVEVAPGDLTEPESLAAACQGVTTVVATATMIARRLAGAALTHDL